jgi:C4-dicarboxylate-specific signal transduction histidine kinase
MQNGSKSWKFHLPKWLRLPSRSISKRILAALLIMSSIITTIITGCELAFDYFQDVKMIDNSLSLVGRAYLKSIEASLWELDRTQLQTGIDGILSIPGVKYVEVISDQSHIRLQVGNKPAGKTVEKTFPLEYEQRPGVRHALGHLSVYADLDEVIQRVYRKAFVIFLAQLVKTFIITMSMYLVIQKILTRHLIRITDYLKKLQLKNNSQGLILEREKTLGDQDELDSLVESINIMRLNLICSYEELEKLNRELESKVDEKTRTILEQRQKLEYAAKMRSLGEMAGGIAHEVNSPLTIIGMSNEVIIRALQMPEVDREGALRSGKLIHKTVKRIADIVQSLLKFSRDGSRDPLMPTSLKDILRDTLYLCQQKLNNTQVNLRTTEMGADILIQCRPVEISQVLLNLLINAFDATKAASERWIHLEIQEMSEEVLIIVSDSGPGIPPELRHQIFQPFFSTKAAGEGTGLGLSISQRIIEDHGGRLYLDEDSIHTRFVISLPKLPGSFLKDT